MHMADEANYHEDDGGYGDEDYGDEVGYQYQQNGTDYYQANEDFHENSYGPEDSGQPRERDPEENDAGEGMMDHTQTEIFSEDDDAATGRRLEEVKS